MVQTKENTKIPPFWKEEDFEQLEKIKTISDPSLIMSKVLLIGRRIMVRSPHQLAVVCGPISSGGGTVEENLKQFQLTISKVERKMPIFNQMPFEPLFGIVHEMIKDDYRHTKGESSSHFFIEHFYEKIFNYNKQWFPHFIYGWEKSIGASREHEIFSHRRAIIQYLPANY